ncbi:MAG: hypothetical protein ACT4ON_13590 [Bacteroidota bacterium]
MEIQLKTGEESKYFELRTYLLMIKTICNRVKQDWKENPQTSTSEFTNYCTTVLTDIPIKNIGKRKVFFCFRWRKIEIKNLVGLDVSVSECVIFNDVIPDFALDKINELKKMEQQNNLIKHYS